MNNQKVSNQRPKLYKIIDRERCELPPHYSGRQRTYDEAKKLVDALNKNGKYGPYEMIEE